MKNDIHDLTLVLESRLRLIAIESWDERRVLETLTGLAVNRGLVLQVWSVTEGLRHLVRRRGAGWRRKLCGRGRAEARQA